MGDFKKNISYLTQVFSPQNKTSYLPVSLTNAPFFLNKKKWLPNIKRGKQITGKKVLYALSNAKKNPSHLHIHTRTHNTKVNSHTHTFTTLDPTQAPFFLMLIFYLCIYLLLL